MWVFFLTVNENLLIRLRRFRAEKEWFKCFLQCKEEQRIGKGPDSSFSELSVKEKIEAFFGHF